eukprot:NODE_247_length_11822_cov_1.182718.p4 type:complete len:268 gc:universal NODE_247_length_11822_cov_1.182718:6350-5547(-)
MTSLDCCTGFLEVGSPKGIEETVAGYKCYVSKPKSNSERSLILAPDAFGFTLPNTRLIADQFAERGYLVVVPDIFQGFVISPKRLDPVFGFNLEDTPSALKKVKQLLYRTLCFVKCIPDLFRFMLKHKPKDKVKIVSEISTELKQKYRFVGLQGYCFGGSVALLAGMDRCIDAVVASHPGKFNWERDFQKIKVPTLLQLAENDFMIKKADILSVDEACKNNSDLKKYQFKCGTQHGFAVRADTRKSELKKAKEEAFEMAIEFFANVK